MRNRQDTAGFQCWHPDGTPFSDADYRRANLPVPTPEQLAHWAETERWIDNLRAKYDTDEGPRVGPDGIHLQNKD